MDIKQELKVHVPSVVADLIMQYAVSCTTCGAFMEDHSSDSYIIDWEANFMFCSSQCMWLSDAYMRKMQEYFGHSELIRLAKSL